MDYVHGDIEILADNWHTYNDLHISDVNNSNLGRYGKYSNEWGTDGLKFNIAEMDDLSFSEKQNIATHELGHSLGLAHSIPNNIMVEVGEIDRTQLGTQDKKDYDYLWK